MKTLIWSASLVCAAVLTADPSSIETREILPAAKAGFTLEVKGDAAPSLFDLLKEYERVTGMHLVLSQDTLAVATRTRAGVTQTLVLPQDKVHALVETFLAEAGFCTVLLHAEEPVLLAVKESQDTVLGANAVNVAATDLASIEKHSALICSTTVDVDSLTADELVPAMQAWKERDFRAVIMLRGPYRVLLTGKGKDVAIRARMLQELNESARRRIEEAKKSSEGSIK